MSQENSLDYSHCLKGIKLRAIKSDVHYHLFKAGHPFLSSIKTHMFNLIIQCNLNYIMK